MVVLSNFSRKKAIYDSIIILSCLKKLGLKDAAKLGPVWHAVFTNNRYWKTCFAD